MDLEIPKKRLHPIHLQILALLVEGEIALFVAATIVLMICSVIKSFKQSRGVAISEEIQCGIPGVALKIFTCDILLLLVGGSSVYL